ncbi:VCBS domain-containing protein, partial [Rhizobium rhizoryzae]|uniref:VCBS domain-containing protein n=1 Tax=Rhizobium rhizoryzae TaxID=451876 RepID=UPI002899A914
MASIQGIYIALFGRPADPAGLAFFNTATKNGADLGAIGNLAGTAEYQSRFTGQTNDQIVNSIYQSLFGRSGEASGVSFWVSQLTSGRFNINNIAIAILDGAQGSDLATVNAKIAAANIFTTHLDLPAEITAYVGNTAAGVGRDYISSITTTNAGTNDNADAAILRLLNGTGGQTPANGGDVGGGTGGGGPVNTPATFSGDDKGTVKEDSIKIDSELLKSTARTELPITAEGKLDVADADANQAGMQAATVKGVYGSLEIDTAGSWTYTLDNDATNVQELKEGVSVTDAIVVRSIDGTAHTITITVEGTNDAATFTGDSTGSVKEESALTFSGKLVATDVDHDETGFQAASDVAGTYGKLSIDAEGKWTYTLDNTNKDVQALGENSKPLTDTVKVQSFDGTEAAITVTINGTNDDATITGTNSGDVAEDGTATTGATLTVSDIDTGENVVSVPENLNGTYGSFKLAADGTWSYDLANSSAAVQGLQGGEKVTDTLTVKSADGTATETLTVNITGKNDVATFTGDSTGSVKEESALTF